MPLAIVVLKRNLIDSRVDEMGSLSRSIRSKLEPLNAKFSET